MLRRKKDATSVPTSKGGVTYRRSGGMRGAESQLRRAYCPWSISFCGATIQEQ